MSTILLTLGTFVLILVSLFLMLVILMQRASSSGGLGAAFGGGVADSALGADAGNILTKATIWATVGFFSLALVLYLGYMGTMRPAPERPGLLPAGEEQEALPVPQTPEAPEGVLEDSPESSPPEDDEGDR